MDSAARAELNQQMVQLAGGDRSAIVPIYRLLWPVLCTFVRRQLPRSDSDDAAQEALIKMFARAPNFDPKRDALVWALGIAAFEVRTARKRTLRRREEFVEQPPSPVSACSPEDDIIARDLEAAAIEALGTLRPSDIETLKLAASGETPAVPRATSRKRVERALKRLKLAWRTKHGTD